MPPRTPARSPPCDALMADAALDGVVELPDAEGLVVELSLVGMGADNVLESVGRDVSVAALVVGDAGRVPL
jgi:hypothetical protein